MDNLRTFHAVDHKLEKQVELDEGFAQIDTPAGFKNVQLYPHQATVVRAMLDIESRRMVKVATPEFFDFTTDEAVIETSAMVLSEPFGSGKTFEILALILASPIPRAFPDHENHIVMVDGGDKKRLPARRVQKVDGFKYEIVRRFTGPDALIKPNLIVVGSSVLIQWENAIKTHTNLKVFSVGNYHTLVKFYKMYNEKQLKAFDIILLKNGTVTGNFTLPGEKPEDQKDYRSLVTVMGKITTGACWSRVIYDDFDTIKIPPESGGISALFTIYVSATTKEAPATKKKNVEYATIQEALAERVNPLNETLRDKVLFTNFNVRNKKAYVDESINIPIINKFRCVYDNPDDNYIRLLGAMGEEDANNIMEMLNGDAIATAAEAMGVKTNSVADIFKRMLDKKYERYMHDQYVLETIDKVKQLIPGLEEHPDGKKYTIAELDAIRSAIAKKTVPGDKLKFYSVNLEQLLDEMHTEYTQSHEQNGLAIHRVIDNLKEGSCQVCCLPLEGMDAFIVRCCGLIVCDVCGIKGNQIRKQYSYKTKTETLFGSCANCKADIYPQTDLIFVDHDFDLNAILEAKGDEMVEPVEPPTLEDQAKAEAIQDSAAEKIAEIKNPKLKALLQIVKGIKPENAEKTETTIKHLLEGRVDRPAPEGQQRKVLVFANYNETLHLIEDFLREHGVEYLRLGGTFKEVADTVKRFQHYGQVLLINSQQHCAGINAQFCTDMVFFHKLVNEHVESQVMGRGQRIGRKYNMRMWYLLYKNEKALVENQNDRR